MFLLSGGLCVGLVHFDLGMINLCGLLGQKHFLLSGVLCIGLVRFDSETFTLLGLFGQAQLFGCWRVVLWLCQFFI